MEINGQYYLVDYESGYRYPVSKEYHDAYNERIKSFMLQVKPKTDNIISKPIIVGTAGDMDNSQDFKEIFYNPKNYNNDNRT